MTPGRAVYEYRRPGDPLPSILWEELAKDGRDFYEEQAQAGIAVSPAVELRDVKTLAEMGLMLDDRGALIDEMLADIERAVPGWVASGKTSLWRLRRSGGAR